MCCFFDGNDRKRRDGGKNVRVETVVKEQQRLRYLMSLMEGYEAVVQRQ